MYLHLLVPSWHFPTSFTPPHPLSLTCFSNYCDHCASIDVQTLSLLRGLSSFAVLCLLPPQLSPPAVDPAVTSCTHHSSQWPCDYRPDHNRNVHVCCCHFRRLPAFRWICDGVVFTSLNLHCLKVKQLDKFTWPDSLHGQWGEQSTWEGDVRVYSPEDLPSDRHWQKVIHSIPLHLR